MAPGKYVIERVVTEEIDLDILKSQIDSMTEKVAFLNSIPDKQRLIEWREMVLDPRVAALDKLNADFKKYTKK